MKLLGNTQSVEQSEIELMCEQCRSEYDTRGRRWERYRVKAFSDVVKEIVKWIEGGEDLPEKLLLHQ